MAVKVGINGFGRIGRNIMRAAMGHNDIDFVAVEIEGDGEITEPLRDAPDVLVVAQRLIEKIGRGHHEDDRGEKAIEEIHANLRKRKPLR